MNNIKEGISEEIYKEWTDFIESDGVLTYKGLWQTEEQVQEIVLTNKAWLLIPYRWQPKEQQSTQ